jgi:PST family polysaccharide transporter
MPDPTLDPTPEPDGDQLTPSSRNLTGTVLRGVGLAAIGYVLTQALTLGFYVALARLATPTDFGQFAAGSLVVSVGLLFSESGMLAALIQRRDRVEEAASTAVISTALGGLLLSLLALALSPLIGAFFESSRVGSLAAVMSGLLFVRGLKVVPDALLQRRFSFIRRMVVEPAQAIALGVAAVIATANGLGPWGLVIGLYAAAVTDVLLSWPLARWRPRFDLASFSMWRELIGYGRHLIAANLAHRLGDQVPKLVLGRFVGEAALGQYRYADRVAWTPVMLLISGGAYVLLPAFARISHETPRFRWAFLRSLRWFGILGMPLGLILLPLGVPLVVLVFGDVWRDAGYAAMALSGFAVASTLISIQSEAFKAVGQPSILVRVHIVSGVAATAAMLALLPFDLVGVVGGVSLGTMSGAIYGLVRVSQAVGVRLGEVLAQLWAPLVAALIMAAALLPVEFMVIDAADRPTIEGLLMVAVEGLIAAVVYIVALIALAPGTPAEFRDLARTMRRDRREPGAAIRVSGSAKAAESAGGERADRA